MTDIFVFSPNFFKKQLSKFEICLNCYEGLKSYHEWILQVFVKFEMLQETFGGAFRTQSTNCDGALL